MEECLAHPSSHILTPLKTPPEWQNQIALLTPTPSATETPITTPASSDYDRNWSNEELIVRSVLSKLVNIPQEKIERHMPIYRFGLDSIGAVQLASSLRRENRIIATSAIMANPTLAGIASHIKADAEEEVVQHYDFEGFQRSVTSDLTSVADIPNPPEAVLPCSPVQQGMISQFITSDGQHYFNFSSWSLDHNVDSDLLLQAWARLVACHPILRTGFVTVNHHDSSFAMVVYPPGATPIPVTKLQDRPADITQWRSESTQNALKSLHRPPWQVALVDDGSSQGTMHLAMHHALYDAHSLRILIHDLARIVKGENDIAAPSIQASLARIIKTSALLPDAEAFWRDQADKLVVNNFPTLTPLRVDKKKFPSISAVCRMSPDLLRHSAAEAGVTIQAALQGAWTRLLSSYHGETSVTFGVVLDGRPSEESRRSVFPMISTLPVLAQNFESNQELLQSMLKYNASIRQFEQTPLSNIQRWLGLPDGALFDTILVYQVADTESDRLPWTVLDEAASVDYAVSLEVEETSDTLQFNLTFDESVLPIEQATMVVKQLDHILVDLVTYPAGNRREFSTSSPGIYSILPPLKGELPSSVALLHQFVEQSVSQKPGAVALEFVDELDDRISCRKWTYQELDEKGNLIANLLLRRNIPPKSIVAICFDKCPEAYFSILGILKAGCAFLALDPSAPSSRQEFILRDSGAACLLIAEGARSGLEFISPVPIHEVGERIYFSREDITLSTSFPILPSDTCYCLYTSGTTGTPKGCLISHDNAVQAMLAFQELFAGHWDSESRWLQFASFHFDVSVLEQYWSWSVGIAVVAAPRDLILSDLVATISKLEITHIDLTPSLARLVHPDEVPSLCRGVFITGGEQLRQDVLDNWGPKEVIYNAYGPTEATIGVTMFQRVPVNGRSSNIGRLFPNVGGYVFQPGTELSVLKGGVGELCVSGRLVGMGYLNRPDLTAERFPTLKAHGERVYRTGDLVRVLHDGTFDFLGRADDQVKLRGQRLEIGEINHAIKVGVPEVTDVATLVTRHGGHDRDLLVSFVAPVCHSETTKELCVLADKQSLDITKAAQNACKGRLPGYMVPTYVFCIPFIPLSANNKADLKELKRLFNELSQEQLRTISTTATGRDRGLSGKEQQIAGVLAEITGMDLASIRPSSTIFELGIDSITVTRVARNLHRTGFPSVSPSLVLKSPQISQLALALGQVKASVMSSKVRQVRQSIHASYRKYLGLVRRTLGVTKEEIEYIAPCTALQEGMLTRMRTAGNHSAYFNQFRIDLDPSMSVGRLKEAWTRVINACSILRTSFIQTSDGYVQVALKGSPLPWTSVQNGDEGVESYLATRYRAWVESNHEVMRCPIELDYINNEGEHILALRMFHAVYDAHSFELIMKKVLGEYHQGSGSEYYGPQFLDVLPRGPLLTHNSSRPFWESLFRNHLFQPLPALTKIPSSSDTAISRTIHPGNLEPRRVALGVTYQTVLQAAWLAVLQQYFETPPTIGVVFSGRSILLDGIEDVIGPMFNTLPFRVEASELSTWKSLVHHTHEYNTSVLDFVHTPLRDIQKWCSRGRPLFDTLFTFDRENSSESDEGRYWSSVTSTAPVDYPLALEVLLTREGSLTITLVAQGGVADEESLGTLLDKFQQALASLADSDDDTVIPTRGRLVNTDDKPLDTRLDVPDRNDALSLTQVETPTFEWTYVAKKLRNEISRLADLPETEITETNSILELGLDSIDAIKLSARLSKLGIRVATSELMRKATIERILASQQVNHAPTNDLDTPDYQWDKLKYKLWSHLEKVGVNSADIEDVFPPTPLQDAMVADMLMSDFRRYFNHDVLEIAPGTDLDRLRCAWATVHANSPILRTSFEQVDDPDITTAFVQVVRNSSLEFGPTVKVSSPKQAQAVIDQARNLAQQENGRSKLFQITIMETEISCYAIVSISHALYDGWSLGLLYQDVQDAYDGSYQARRPYESYLAHILSSVGTASRNFWADLMHDVRPTHLSIVETPESRDPVVYRAEVTSRLTVPNIKALCRVYRITPQVLCQGCWAAVLATLASSLDITFGTVISGRDTEEAQELLFPTMNTIPMRVLLHGTVAGYLRSIQDTMSEIQEFQHIPLREVQRLSNVQNQNLFNTLFILQNLNHPKEKQPLMTSVQGSSAVEYPLCVEMELSGESAIWRIACDERLGSSDKASRILNDLEVVLQYFTQNQDTEVVQFDPDTDQARICNLRSITPDDDPRLPETEPSIRASQSNDEEWTGKHSPIVDVLAMLSGVERDSINPEDSIYHLGLDSISAMKASSILRKSGIRIPVREFVKATSIGQLLKHRSIPDGTPREPLLYDHSFLKDLDLPSLLEDAGLDGACVEKILPALPMQVYMLTMWQNTSGSLFFPTFSYRVIGQLSREIVANAWSMLTAEISILRTHFIATGSPSTPFVQVLLQPGKLGVVSKETTEILDSHHWSLQAAGSSFASLTVRGSDTGESSLDLHIHHALYDGVSLPMIINRFAELCCTNKPSSLNSLDFWYRFTSEHARSDIKSQAERFWTSYLNDAPLANQLKSYPAKNGPIRHVAMLQKDVLTDLGTLKRSASTHGVTLQSLFFAAYAQSLASARKCHENGTVEDIVFGVYMANRLSFPELEEAPHPTLNILPLRIRSSSSKSILSIAAEIQRDLYELSTFANSTASLWDIHQWTGVTVDTFVNFLSLPETPIEDQAIMFEELPPGSPVGEGRPDLAHPGDKWLSRNHVRDSYVVS